MQDEKEMKPKVEQQSIDEQIEAVAQSAATQRNLNGTITTLMKIHEENAIVLLDSGTTGTNLMSTSFAQTNNIQMRELHPPVTIMMATKGSKTVAKYSATTKVEIKKGTTVETKFDIVPITSHNVILGMPFLIKNNVVLDPAGGRAVFKDHNYSVKCAKRPVTALMTTAATNKLPDFRKEFPEVFPEKVPEELPPLREGCNH